MSPGETVRTLPPVSNLRSGRAARCDWTRPSRASDVHERRALETAISVCYARPWLGSNRVGKLRNKWLPAAGCDRDLHKRLLELRRKTYAHTDPDGGRTALAQLGPGNIASIGEQWMPLRGDELPESADLCERQAARFKQEIGDALDGAQKPAQS
jgi:hypothetical protein